MRPLETVGFILASVSVLAFLIGLPQFVGIAAAAIAGGTLIVSAFWLGAYWQLFPLYLAVGIVLLLRLSVRKSKWIRAALVTAAACLLIMTAGFTYVLPMFRLPKPTGSYAVGTRIVHLVDPKRVETHVSGAPRPREIMVQIWYPADPHGQHLAGYRRRRETTLLSSYMSVLWTHSYRNAPVANGGPFPVLLFNPGWEGQRTQNTYQTEDLASHGFVVVGIDHTYNSRPVAFPDGRVVGAVNGYDISDFQHITLRQKMAIGDREVRIEAGDDILALNYLSSANSNPASPWFHHVDADDAGAFGHSFGGAVAEQTCYEDPRVKAAVNEDGWTFGDVATRGLDKPLMVMSDDSPPITMARLQSTNVQTRREAEWNVEDMNNIMQTMHRFGGYFFTIVGAKHFNFADRSLYSPFPNLTDSGTISPRRAHEIVENYTLQFFSQYLLAKPAPLLAAKGTPYKEVQFENWFAQDAATR